MFNKKAVLTRGKTLDKKAQPRPQRNFKKIALAPHDFAGKFYSI